MAKENNNKSFVLRIDAATMDALELWAADEFRSINGQLQWIIADALRRSGRLKKPRAAAGATLPAADTGKVTHLHGELTCLRSSRNPDLVVPIEGWEQKLDATAPDGALLRPHIVFFGEAVPMFERAAQIARTADIMVVVGTSLAVYPAASLVRCVRPGIPIYVVDPGNPDTAGIRNPLTLIRKRAAEGMPGLAELLREKYAAG